jgi:ferredoxin, 2Fe-2S
MAQITWQLADGRHLSTDVNAGDNLMQAASMEGVPGIDGDCGGCLSCATCHVVVDGAWVARVGPPGTEEADMLNHTLAQRQEHSRLSCQIVVRPELDGLLLHVPST